MMMHTDLFLFHMRQYFHNDSERRGVQRKCKNSHRFYNFFPRFRSGTMTFWLFMLSSRLITTAIFTKYPQKSFQTSYQKAMNFTHAETNIILYLFEQEYGYNAILPKKKLVGNLGKELLLYSCKYMCMPRYFEGNLFRPAW